MPESLTNPALPAANETLSEVSIPVCAAIRVGSHRFPFSAQFIPFPRSLPGSQGGELSKSAAANCFGPVHEDASA